MQEPRSGSLGLRQCEMGGLCCARKRRCGEAVLRGSCTVGKLCCGEQLYCGEAVLWGSSYLQKSAQPSAIRNPQSAISNQQSDSP